MRKDAPASEGVKLALFLGVPGSEWSLSIGSLKDTRLLGVPRPLSEAAESPLLVFASFRLLDKRRLLGPTPPLLSGDDAYTGAARECAGVLAKM